MPSYKFRCTECGSEFDELYLSYKKAKKEEECPQCGGVAHRVFTVPGISINSGDIDRELAGDPEEYREMHYYEKKKDWKKAARAAEGVSDFARDKFLQKARQEEEK